MIEPVKITKLIKQGTNSAMTTFEKGGFSVKFDKGVSPEFIANVGQICDQFVYGNKVEKTSKGLQQLVQDVFERSSNAVK